jgi:hypothetical protein
VRIDPTVWDEEVGRFAEGPPARVAAERERRGLERDGVALRRLLPCEPEGGEGTRLAGLVKTYVPIGDRPASERPFGFVLSPEQGRHDPYLELVAFGERHPELSGTRSVYERAHKRLHGRYPRSVGAGRRHGCLTPLPDNQRPRRRDHAPGPGTEERNFHARPP